MCDEDGVDINYTHVKIKTKGELEELIINNNFIWKNNGHDDVLNFNDDGTMTTLGDKMGHWEVYDNRTVEMNYMDDQMIIQFGDYGE